MFKRCWFGCIKLVNKNNIEDLKNQIKTDAKKILTDSISISWSFQPILEYIVISKTSKQEKGPNDQWPMHYIQPNSKQFYPILHINVLLIYSVSVFKIFVCFLLNIFVPNYSDITCLQTRNKTNFHKFQRNGN